MSKHVVGPAAELPPGSRRLVTAAGRTIAVFNVAGEYFALLDRCPHRGGSLCEGKLTGLVRSSEPGEYQYLRHGEILRCPWHGWEFDIRTGRAVCDPERMRARSYAVTVEQGEALATDGALSLEKFPVSVEDAYVVLTLPDRPG